MDIAISDIGVIVGKFFVPILSKIHRKLVDIAAFEGLEYLGCVSDHDEVHLVYIETIAKVLLIFRPPLSVSSHLNGAAFL